MRAPLVSPRGASAPAGAERRSARSARAGSGVVARVSAPKQRGFQTSGEPSWAAGKQVSRPTRHLPDRFPCRCPSKMRSRVRDTIGVVATYSPSKRMPWVRFPDSVFFFFLTSSSSRFGLFSGAHARAAQQHRARRDVSCHNCQTNMGKGGNASLEWPNRTVSLKRASWGMQTGPCALARGFCAGVRAFWPVGSLTHLLFMITTRRRVKG